MTTELDNLFTFAVIIIVMLAVFTMVMIEKASLRCDRIMDGLERYEMYSNKTIEPLKGILTGLYFTEEKYYTTWIDGRNESEINKTNYHEYCHYLTNEKYEHFCK